MSYKFSERSKHNLSEAHEDLQRLFNAVGKEYNCTILCSHRDEETQNIAFHSGRSKVEFPGSKHNKNPSLAVDVAPYPVNWQDMHRWYHFGGYVLKAAIDMGIKIRWGGDWNGNLNFKDQHFDDLPHFELILEGAD